MPHIWTDCVFEILELMIFIFKPFFIKKRKRKRKCFGKYNNKDKSRTASHQIKLKRVFTKVVADL